MLCESLMTFSSGCDPCRVKSVWCEESIAYAGLPSATGRLAFASRKEDLAYAGSGRSEDVPVGAGLYFQGMTATPVLQRPRGVELWRARLAQPRWRAWLLYLPACLMSTSLAVTVHEGRQPGYAPGAELTDGGALLFLVGIGAACALLWRRRFPEIVVLATSVPTLLLPLDPVAALIAFGSLLVRRCDRVAVGLGALVATATFVTTWRDTRGTSIDTSFWQFLRSSDPTERFEPLPWWVTVLIAAVLMGAVVGLALLVRYRAGFTQASAAVAQQQVVVEHLSDEVGRQAERERIAQEVHDALGHRLSLLSLHAGALEVASEDDPRRAQSAALVRANSQQAMADLRSLLAVLRHPDSPDVAAAVPTLRDLPALIDETVATGVTIVSTVQLEGLSRLDETTSRSAFRITQELLTNARRHAVGIGIRVLVRATPETGVEIEVANHLPHGAPIEFRPGSGLGGIRNRVHALGGNFECFVDQQRVFRVASRMPWVWVDDTVAAATPTPQEER
jgi:signal transduction histidine kinase